MELGLIGLGRMGANMSRRWIKEGHRVVGYARTQATVDGLVQDGALSEGSTSPAERVRKLSSPRTAWLLVPAAAAAPTVRSSVMGQPYQICVNVGPVPPQRGVKGPCTSVAELASRVGHGGGAVVERSGGCCARARAHRGQGREGTWAP